MTSGTASPPGAGRAALAAGLAFAVGGWFLASLITCALGASVGRPVLQRLLGHRFAWLAHTVERGGTPLLLSSRLISVIPFALMGYAAGATHASLWRFSWTTVIGYLPLTAAVAYLGSRAQTFSTSDPLVWVAVAIVVALLLTERVARRRLSTGERSLCAIGSRLSSTLVPI